MAMQPENFAKSIQHVSQNFSSDMLKIIQYVVMHTPIINKYSNRAVRYFIESILIKQSLCINACNYQLLIHRYLLGAQSAMHNISEVMSMIGARFYSTIESLQLNYDITEAQLAKVCSFVYTLPNI